jgi:hypothetical protein
LILLLAYSAYVNLRTNKLYGGVDPREVPTYSVAEAAHLAQVPVSTLAHWVAGQPKRRASFSGKGWGLPWDSAVAAGEGGSQNRRDHR